MVNNVKMNEEEVAVTGPGAADRTKTTKAVPTLPAPSNLDDDVLIQVPPALERLMKNDPSVVVFIGSIRGVAVEQEFFDEIVGGGHASCSLQGRDDGSPAKDGGGPDKNDTDEGAASASLMITDGGSTCHADVTEKYRIDDDEIGCGHYGIVRKCHSLGDSLDDGGGGDETTPSSSPQRRTYYAIKSIPKNEQETKARGKKLSRLDFLRREVQILTDVSSGGHPRIVRHYGTYEDETYIHLITELCTGGMLFDRIVKRDRPIGEKAAAHLVHSILDAVAYLHDAKNIVHRDIKPENFLFLTDDSDDASGLKLIDFGLSRIDPLTEPMRTSVGTAYYVAPEVIARSYGKSCDLWSVGVVAYMILCGYYPFYGDTTADIVKHVKSGIFDFPSNEWDKISMHGKDFVKALLKVDPRERLTASEALGHKWIVKQTGMRKEGRKKKMSGMERLRKSLGSLGGSRNASSKSVLPKSAVSTSVKA